MKRGGGSGTANVEEEKTTPKPLEVTPTLPSNVNNSYEVSLPVPTHRPHLNSFEAPPAILKSKNKIVVNNSITSEEREEIEKRLKELEGVLTVNNEGPLLYLSLSHTHKLTYTLTYILSLTHSFSLYLFFSLTLLIGRR